MPTQDHVRLLFVNIGGLQAAAQCPRVRPCGTCKDCLVRSTVNNLRVDILGMSEINVNWHKVSIHQRLEQRTKGWFEASRVVSATYAGQSTATQQYGGTSLMSINKMATRVDSRLTFRDDLGRWSGQGYRGRNGQVLVAIVAYRPVVNKSGEQSVWSQQYAHFAKQRQEVDPIQLYDKDLQSFVTELQEKQYHIVLGIDANEDLSAPKSGFRQRMEEVGLQETLLAQHGPGPPTMKQGSTTIDGLFVSAALRDYKCGYTGFIADHRGVMLEIPMQAALGHSIPAIVRPAMRRLKLQDPRIVAKYLTAYKAEVESAEMGPALQCLWDKAVGQYNPQATESPLNYMDHIIYDRLDAACTKAMLEAERTCRKLYLGEVPWSPAYIELKQYRRLLHTVSRRQQGHKVGSQFLFRLAKQLQKQEVLTWTKAKLRRTLKEVQASVQTFKDQLALNARRTHNEKLVESIAAHKGIEATTVIKCLMNREERKTSARIIRNAVRSAASGAVSMVQSFDASGNLITWTGKEDMEAAIMTECQNRFRQASGTDFLTHPLYNHVGPLGITPFCDRVLAGEIRKEDLAEVSVYAKKLLEQMRRPIHLREQFCNPIPSLEVFQYGWKIQKEGTGAYPGRHFGHMMAHVQDPTLAEFHRQLEYLPMLTGQPPSSWCKAIDVMIEKKAGNFQVDKLRAICLFDLIANHSFKFLGKAMMSEAEKNNLLAKEQGGSRRGHRANYIGLEKRLSFDMSRQLRQPMALCSNDARACYDRIVHSVAALSLQRVGVPKSAVRCMFSTIQGLEHHIRTTFGDSVTYFGGTSDAQFYEVPPSTIGQGNGAGPQIWAIVSTPLLNMLREEGLVMAFKGALSALLGLHQCQVSADLQVAQQCSERFPCFGHWKVEFREVSFWPIQAAWQICNPSAVTMSERNTTCKYSRHRLTIPSVVVDREPSFRRSSISRLSPSL